MLAALTRLADPRAVEEAVARELGPELKTVLQATLSAGQTPEGKTWAPRRVKGGRAYAHAADRLTVNVYRSLVVAQLKGPEVYGHFGAHGITERPMLPDAGASLPKSVEQAMIRAGERALKKLQAGAR